MGVLSYVSSSTEKEGTFTLHFQILMPFGYVVVLNEPTKTLKLLYSMVKFALAAPSQSSQNHEYVSPFSGSPKIHFGF